MGFLIIFTVIMVFIVVFIFIKSFCKIFKDSTYSVLVNKTEVYFHVYDTKKRRYVQDGLTDYVYTVRFNKTYDGALDTFDKSNLITYTSRISSSLFELDRGFVCKGYECIYSNSKGKEKIFYSMETPEKINRFS